MIKLDVETGKLIPIKHKGRGDVSEEFSTWDLYFLKHSIDIELKNRKKKHQVKEHISSYIEEQEEEIVIPPLIEFYSIGASRYPRHIDLKFSTNLSSEELDIIEKELKKKVKQIEKKCYTIPEIVTKRFIRLHANKVNEFKENLYKDNEETIIKQYNKYMIVFLKEIEKYKHIIEKDNSLNSKILLKWLMNKK